jgi:lysophospholipase L1-like esterase
LFTDLAARNWVQQLHLQRAADFNFGPLTDDPSLYGEPRLRGHEYNFARVSGTVLAPGLGKHDMAPQIEQLLPYLEAGHIDVVLVMIGSNDFAAREIYQKSFCGEDWEDFQNDFINTLFQGVDAIRQADPDIQLLVAELPLGTAVGRAGGFVLDAILDTNNRIRDEAQQRGIPTIDVWAFNQDPVRTHPTTGETYIGGYTIPVDSVADADDAVPAGTPGSGVMGACRTDGRCGTLATTLNYVADDGLHPGSIAQGLVANEIIKALNMYFGYSIASLSDNEILDAGGTFVPGAAQLTDPARWTQIRQKGSNRCLAVEDDDRHLTVARCRSSDPRQQWYVMPYNDAYQIRSAHSVSGHASASCIEDDGYKFEVAQCSADADQQFNIHGGAADRNWFLKTTNGRDACIYRYAWFEGGQAYGANNNCVFVAGWNYMRWGFYLNGTSALPLAAVLQ